MSANQQLKIRISAKIFTRAFTIFVISSALSLASHQCDAANVPPFRSAFNVPATSAGVIALSDETMAATTAQGMQSLAPQAVTANRSTITLWDEVKPPAQPMTSGSGMTTITLNGTTVR